MGWRSLERSSESKVLWKVSFGLINKTIGLSFSLKLVVFQKTKTEQTNNTKKTNIPNGTILLTRISPLKYTFAFKKVKIAIIGYGKMGKAVEEIALERGHEISVILDSQDYAHHVFSESDIAIEFSQPSECIENIKKCFKANIPVVVGTTGWYENYTEIKNLALSQNQAIITATNFSIGVNMFFKINEMVAAWANKKQGYNCSIHEVHHLQKLDAPSGTAITLAETIIKQSENLEDWKYFEKPGGAPNHKTLPISAAREKDVKGIHEVIFENEIDLITLKHEAKNRKGFASGAVVSAEWLLGKKGVFKINEMINEIFTTHVK